MAGGWYDDGVTPGVVRWFDGTTWTGYTHPVGPRSGPPNAAQAMPAAEHSRAATAAGFGGLLALGILAEGPMAIWRLGQWALENRVRDAGRRGRVIFVISAVGALAAIVWGMLALTQ